MHPETVTEVFRAALWYLIPVGQGDSWVSRWGQIPPERDPAGAFWIGMVKRGACVKQSTHTHTQTHTYS